MKIISPLVLLALIVVVVGIGANLTWYFGKDLIGMAQGHDSTIFPPPQR